MIPDIFTDSRKVFVHIGIGISENRQSLPMQILIPCGIGLLAGQVIMLGTVQLNDQFVFRNIEIYDIGTDDLLPVDGNRERFQKIIPKMPLVAGHIFA